jgi:hypothetical protein
MKTEPRVIEIDEVQGPGRKAREGDNPLAAVISRLMDDIFVIPGTNIRFGLDPLIGLIPGFGDTAGAVVSTFLLIQGSRAGLPKIVLARMALNVLINSALGAVPVLGDAFSVWFKSNVRNLALLERHAGAGIQRQSRAADWLFVGGLIIAILAVAALSVAGLILFVDAVLRLAR